jgi:hypothetical protein
MMWMLLEVVVVESNQKKGVIVSIVAARKYAPVPEAVEPKKQVKAEKAPAEEVKDFDDLMRLNDANRERLRQERLKANISVLKSYRITE